MTAGASAFEFDGFEDGDFTSDPTWQEFSNGGSAQVQGTTVKNGDFAVEIVDESTLAYERSTPSLSDGETYSTWINTDDLFSTSLYGLSEGTDPESSRGLVMRVNNEKVRFVSFDSSGFIDFKDAVSSGTITRNTWFRLEIETNPSTNEATGRVYDSSNSFLGSATITTAGSSSLEHTVIETDNGGVTTRFDDVAIDDVTNTPPQFKSSSVTPDPPLIGQTADFSYTASDPDGTISSVDLVLKDDGTQIFSGSKSSASATFSPPDTLTQGDITAEFTATDNKGGTATTTLTRNLVDNPPSVQVFEPTDLKNTKEPAFNVSVDSTGDSDPSEQVTVELFKDGAKFDTRTITGKGFVSGSASFDSEGSHSFKAVASENAGSNQDSSTFTVDTTPPGIQILQPDGKTNDTQGIPLKFQAADATSGVDTTTFEYAKDGGTRISTAGNTTINYGTTGQHNVTVFADDQANNTGQATKTFTADIKNSLTADTAVANTQIDTFTATFSNATDTLTKNTTNGEIEFFTTELPKGDVTVTVNSPGFTPSNQTLTGVDSTFNQDLNLDLERAGFTFNAFNEQKPSEELDPRTVTISNGTTSQQLNKTEVDMINAFGPFRVIDEGDSATLLDQAKDLPTLKAGELRIEETYGGGSGIMDLEVFVNGNSNGFIDDVGTGTTHIFDIQPKRINSIRIEAFNTDDGDGSNEDAEIQIREITALPPDTGETTLDFEAFEESDLPTGDVDVKVEAPGFQTRTYQTRITGSTKTTLDTFLLPQNQGLRTSVEVLDTRRDPVTGAQVSVQKRIDGAFKTVSQSDTSTAGGASFFLDPDTQYRALVTAPEFVGFEGTFNPANFEFEPFQIILSDASQFNFTTRLQGVSQRLKPQEATLSPNTTLNYTVIDSENSISVFGLQVFNKTGAKILEKVETGSSTGGTVTANLALNDTKEVRVEGFFTSEGERFNYDRRYTVLQPFELGDTSLGFAVQKLEATTGDITQSFIAIIVVSATGIATGRQINRVGGGLLALTVLGGFALIGFVNPAVFTVTLIGVTAAVFFQ